MRITATIDLGDAEKRELASVLDCSEEELAQRLSGFGSAALQEYVYMALGDKVFKRGSDIREYRLFLLIRNEFAGRIPDEEEVSRLFQSTASESRSLIRAVLSKYQYLLRSAINETLRNLLSHSVQEHEGGPHSITVNSSNLVEELNRKLSGIDGTLQQVAKKRGSVCTYEMAPSSYARLAEALGVETPHE